VRYQAYSFIKAVNPNDADIEGIKMATRIIRYDVKKWAPLLLVSFFLLLSASAFGANVRYIFSATITLDESGLFYSGGEPIDGFFDYDSSVTNVVSPSPTVYFAFFNLSGTVDGNPFSDPFGPVAVWDNSLGPGFDAVSLSAEGTTKNLSGFQLTSGSTTYNLEGIFIRWIGSGFVDGETLPATLPPTSGGDVQLAFVNEADSGDRFNVNSSLDSLATVPIPATVWLFGSAVGLLGWLRRRAT
jgi:hypothetical protein